jgi:beta-glucosidase
MELDLSQFLLFLNLKKTTLTMKKILTFLVLLGLIGCKPNKSNLSEGETETKINGIIDKMTLEEKIEMIGGFEEFDIHPLKRLGIPAVRMADGPCGVRNYGPSTAYPAPLNTAASWDTLIASEVGKSIAIEAKDKNVQIMLAPAMNIYRAAMCGRNFEYLGEDPYLAGQIASAYIRGMQNEGVMATAKHYAANNQEFDRHHTSSDMDERTLHEIYLPAFKASVEEGHVACIMTSYNPINVVHASENSYIINDILKGKWGFKGFVMSDWGSTYRGVAAANGGLDLEMPSGSFMSKDTLIPAVKDGRLKETVINDKIRRILRMCYRFNLMDTTFLAQQQKVMGKAAADSVIREEWSKTALEAARGGIVLLKNTSGLLPLDIQKIKNVAVLGPIGQEAITGGGGSSLVAPYKSVSVLQGIKDIAAGKQVNVEFAMGPFDKFTKEFYDQTTFEAEGLKGEYFGNEKLEGAPKTTRLDKKINFDWTNQNVPQGFASTNFSARWTGKFKASSTGDYQVAVSGDDGYRLIFDKKQIINQWNYQAEHTESAVVQLQKDKTYDVTLEYFQGGGQGSIRLGIGMLKQDAWTKAIDLAKKSDVAVICVGFNPSLEGEGSDRAYGLPEKQINFIRDIAAVNKKTIVILNAGGNASIADWIDKAGALLHVWYPGQMGGQAIAEILFGKVNPSGKLPFSIEKRWEDSPVFNSYYDADKDKKVTYSEGIFLGYRHFDTHHVEPLFPFGFGLSYASFDYSNLQVDHKEFTADKDVTVSVDVKNTGAVAGKEVTELYVKDVQSALPRPEKELKAFSKVMLSPGETKTVIMKLNKNAFSYYDPSKHDWVAEPGSFELWVGSSSRDIRLKETIVLK